MRNRVTYFILTVITVMLGLVSRKFGTMLPQVIADYSGDILWALMVFFLTGFLFPKISTAKVAFITLIFAFVIEFSQLYHAEWIDTIRRTKLGGLILGFGFLWSDLLCYACGVFIGTAFERIREKLKK